MRLYISAVFILLGRGLLSQIVGTIVDESNVALPSATIYVENTTIGTVGNIDGEYSLALAKSGKYNIVYQYVGYKSETKSVDFTVGKRLVVNVRLDADEVMLSEVTIAADREDPAYAIIRQAIAKRNFHRHQVPALEADLYVKGKVKMLNAPKKIMGQEIGNLGGILDTSRQGILYLSESTSKYYFQDPDKTKEIMISSVKAGENDLFTANRFQIFQFNVYDEYYKFARSIASPLSDNAIGHYKYALESTFYTEDKEKVYRIKMSPKSANEPLLSGYIYIVDDYFNVYSLDASISGPTLRGTFFDTVHFKQIYVPVNSNDNRRLLSQVVTFSGGVMGFKIEGVFTYIFSNYILNPDLSSIFNNNENFSIQKDALKRDSSFWAMTRPIPLTADEENDYTKKDSLAKIWKSKPFLDSLDKANNTFKFIKLITGYTYQNSHKNFELATPKLQELYNFNAVEGSRFKFGLAFSRTDSLSRMVKISASGNYGLADREWKPMLHFRRIYDNYHSAEIYGQLGRKYWQYDYKQPVGLVAQTLNDLFFKLNRIRLYDLKIAEIGWKKEFVNGVYVDFSTSYQDRRSLDNNTNYSIRLPDKIYTSNTPNVTIPDSYYGPNRYFINQIRLTIRPFQKYSSYPNLKITKSSQWPVIEWFFDNYLALSDNSTSFQSTVLTIRDNYVGTKLLGHTRYRLSGGTFLGGKPSFFADFYHPAANEVLFPVINDQLVFNIMPFYQYSTDRYFVEAHWRHHLDGYIFDHIPLIKKTSIKEVLGAALHFDPTNGSYYELTAGIEDIKISALKICDIEYTWSFTGSKYDNQGVVVRFIQLFGGR